ncbi:FMN-binding protein [Flammeovirga kamogawensis]|uniref:4Fe-4S binding protein n=1 Tax=Flammeovirga kamogawensis TaxID=373891 RepID=A0ABX8H471_9BACT|nr:4Fe-4S binding protein [Flammeovirga kamogawensis]MBB6460431.1 uncharacterized protein with FMN-binding domain [Flammeovirga kamogawensis]QWG10236.1 4Fe-4S binding protein [Flammeovirga kamogawensis]TRX64686.1 4Fe-4S binding protein [Flammeovirga kamogawensis]
MKAVIKNKKVISKPSNKVTKKNNNLTFYNLYRIMLLTLLVVAIGFSGGWDLSFSKGNKVEKNVIVSQHHFEKIFKQAKFFTKNKNDKYVIYNKHKDIIGYAISTHDYASDVKGFAGEVPILIGFDNDSTIQNMTLLQNNESDEYMEYIIDEKLLDSWNGLKFDRAQLLDVDGITSATETSEAMIKTVHVTLSEITGIPLHQKQLGWKTILQFSLSFFTILFGLLVCFYKPMKGYRTSLLIMVVIVLGFMYQKMLSISLIHGWIINGISIESNIISFLLIALSVILPLTTKKQFYCHYMCPFGAAQELVGKISPFQKRNLKWLKFGNIPIQTVVSIFLIACIIIGYYPELSYVEPFPSFSIKIVSFWMLGFGALFLGLSLFYSKPWCKICPTGFVIDNCKKKTSRDIKDYKII